MVAAPDLDAARRAFEAETGVAPAAGGAHPGRGTRNALVSFGRLDLSRDHRSGSGAGPRANLRRAPGRAARAGALPLGSAVDGLAAVRERAEAAGFEPSAILHAARSLPSGQRLEWELLGVGGHTFGGAVPFFIDWLEAPHPAEAAPVVGPLLAFELTLDDESPVRDLLDPLPEGVTLRAGPAALYVAFESPRGSIRWATGDPLPTGFGF